MVLPSRTYESVTGNSYGVFERSEGGFVKVFVASKRTQGMRDWDMCYAIDGELVMRPPVSCDCPDCPCERDMVGLGSRAGTTTFTVTDRVDLDVATYRALLSDALLESGWVTGEPDDEWLVSFAERHLAPAARFEIGDALEIGDDRTFVRRTTPQLPAS